MLPLRITRIALTEAIQRAKETIFVRFLVYLVFFATVGFVQGCADHSPTPDTELPPSTMPSQVELIGTWRFISITEGVTGKVHPITDYPFFMRFYADGKVASWPVPKEEISTPGAFNTDAKRVSRGLYKVQDGELTLPDASDSVKARLRITAEKMWYWTADGDTCLYYRVRPDLEPGQLP
jgi:hypothetical protein